MVSHSKALPDRSDLAFGLVPEARQLGHSSGQCFVRQVRVVLAGDARIRMAGQLGNGEQVHARLRQVRGVGMAQLMEGDARLCLMLGRELSLPWAGKLDEAVLPKGSRRPWISKSGIGVNEIRIREGGAFRLIYVAKFSEAVYVLHAFQKKSRKTAKVDIELARKRFRALIHERKQQ